MADIFISYSKAYRALTEALAKDLEARGHSVWWDTELVPGERFRVVIEREIDAAKAVIVIWSPASVTSEWVEAEANRARAQNKLITVRTSDLKYTDIPSPFGGRHCDLVKEREKIYAALARFGLVQSADHPRAVEKKRGRPWTRLGAAGVMIMAAFGLYYAKTLSPIEPEKTRDNVEISAAEGEGKPQARGGKAVAQKTDEKQPPTAPARLEGPKPEEKLYVVAFSNKTGGCRFAALECEGRPGKRVFRLCGAAHQERRTLF